MASCEERVLPTTNDTQPPAPERPQSLPALLLALAFWLRVNWQLVIGGFSALAGGVAMLRADASANTKLEDRLAAVEAAITRGDKRDTESAVTLNREIADLGKRIDSRIQEIFVTLNGTIGENAKRADAREMEMFTSMNKDIGDVAGRIDAGDARTNELRHLRDQEQSAMRERLAVLEAQLQFFGRHLEPSPRAPPPALPVSRGKPP